MIDRKKIYEEVNFMVKNNWGNLILGLVIIMAFNFILQSILDRILPTAKLNTDLLETSPLLYSVNFMYDDPIMYSAIKLFITSFISFIFSGVFSISVLEFIREKNMYQHRKFTIDKFFSNIQKFAPKLLLVAIIITVINTLVSLIPFVGIIISLILTVIFAFVVFVIPDYSEASGLDYFKLSIDKTKGIRKDIVLVTFKYWLLPFAIFLFSIIIVVMIIFGDNLGLGFLGLILIMNIIGIILLIRASVLQSIALAVIYDINYSEQDYNYFRDEENGEDFENNNINEDDYIDKSHYNETYLTKEERDVLYKEEDFNDDRDL